MDRKVAETTCQMVDEIIEKLGRFVAYAHENSADERTRHAVGTCIAKLDSEVLEPIYREFPDLMPEFKSVV
jgi:hypothetical protein